MVSGHECVTLWSGMIRPPQKSGLLRTPSAQIGGTYCKYAGAYHHRQQLLPECKKKQALSGCQNNAGNLETPLPAGTCSSLSPEVDLQLQYNEIDLLTHLVEHVGWRKSSSVEEALAVFLKLEREVTISACMLRRHPMERSLRANDLAFQPPVSVSHGPLQQPPGRTFRRRSERNFSLRAGVPQWMPMEQSRGKIAVVFLELATWPPCHWPSHLAKPHSPTPPCKSNATMVLGGFIWLLCLCLFFSVAGEKCLV